MNKNKWMLLLVVAMGIVWSSCKLLRKQKPVQKAAIPVMSVAADTVKKPVSKLKPYKQVITAKAVTDAGLFKVHHVDDRYYFEIPDTLLEKDMLMVNRIDKATAGKLYGGDEINNKVIRFSKGPNNKIFMRGVSFEVRSADSTANGMYHALANSNIQPIIAAFDIKALSPDGAGSVIDLTDMLNADNDIFFIPAGDKTKLGIGSYQADRSYINRVHSFPLNVEINTTKSYGGVTPTTFELNSSIVLLPKNLMKPRFFNRKVGYFGLSYTDFDNAIGNRVANATYIRRWRMEPKPEDREKYLRGELVEPAKPIVYYIDPATPKKWVPYLIQGINDWQKAFEKAGFKNAIYALEVPKNDPSFSLLDARHNALIYKASPISNAMGPSVVDPRTGEILETHIDWYHNVMELISSWYVIQAGAIDTAAQHRTLSDALMGQLIRFVSSHEVGHTLGLEHNFGASSTIPVEKLRDKQWVEANGHTPSIMDYARFNYVAQPEDHVSQKGIFPRIGIYDEWAINWGYRWLPQFNSAAQEKLFLNQWAFSENQKDHRLWYGQQVGTDPRNMAEDLGDDPVKAGTYGILNLKRIYPNLIKWTYEPGQDYVQLMRLQTAALEQYSRYMTLVAVKLMGSNFTPKTMDEPGAQFAYPGKSIRKSAVAFFQKQLFNTPTWILDKASFEQNHAPGSAGAILQTQKLIVGVLLSPATMDFTRICAEAGPEYNYPLDEYLNDVESGIWRELATNSPVDKYRRALQKAYVIQLNTNLQAIANSSTSDMSTKLKDYTRKLLVKVNRAKVAAKDKDTRLHLYDIAERLKWGLDPKTLGQAPAAKPAGPEAPKGLVGSETCDYLNF